MPTRKIEPNDWSRCFEHLSQRMRRAPKPAQARIEVVSPAGEIRQHTPGSALRGIRYEPDGSFIRLALDEANHLIAQPQEVWLNEEGDEVTWLVFIGMDKTKEIVSIKGSQAVHATPA